MIRTGDLVITTDGYHAIVLDARERRLFLGNGLEPLLLTDEYWEALVPVPLIVMQRGSEPHSNFQELLR